MNQSIPPGPVQPNDPLALFMARPPSQTWEAIPFAGAPQHAVWVWYKPPTAPAGFAVQIPDETRAQIGGQLTVRGLLASAGLDAAFVAVWTQNGMTFDAMGGTNPALDQVIPAPAPNVDPTIAVFLHQQPVPMQPAFVPSGPTAAADANVFERIQTDWEAAVEIEQELSRWRKKLVDLYGRLKSLNRDLTPPERQFASNMDKKDWTDARRWLRDGMNRLSMLIKDYDIGDTSSAGRKKWMVQMYDQYIATRTMFDGIEQAERDFRAYRKMMMTLQINMSGAYTQSGLTAERRASSVMARIQQKVREGTTKKNMLGVMLD